jgi:hypothetical protein
MNENDAQQSGIASKMPMAISGVSKSNQDELQEMQTIRMGESS